MFASDTEYVVDPDLEYSFQVIYSLYALKLFKFTVMLVPLTYSLSQDKLPEDNRLKDSGNE